jgi:hypothetical protein
VSAAREVAVLCAGRWAVAGAARHRYDSSARRLRAELGSRNEPAAWETIRSGAAVLTWVGPVTWVDCGRGTRVLAVSAPNGFA